jgi:NADPH:quinone reductase-like Zn-dependent oxidoreductase
MLILCTLYEYSLGAQSVLDYTAVAFEQTVHDVDLVLATIGGAILRHSMQMVRCGGTMVSLLEQPPQEQAQALGVRAVKFTVEQPFPSSLLLQKIADLMDRRCVKTVVARLLPLREA